MPVATPNRDRQIIKPWVPNIMVRIEGGNSDAAPGNLASRIARNTTEQHSKRKRPPKMATTAAALTDAERFGEYSIKRLYIISET